MARVALTAAIRKQLMDLPVDEQHGDLAEPPHVELFLLRDGASIVDTLDDAELEEDETRYLERCHGGLIVVLLKDGTYSVRYFKDEDAIEDRWTDLCSDLDGGAEATDLRALGDDDGDERRTAPAVEDDEEDTDPGYDEDDDWDEE